MKQSDGPDLGDITFSLPDGRLRKALGYLCFAAISTWLFFLLLGRVVGAAGFQYGALVLAVFVIVVLFVLAVAAFGWSGYEWRRYRTQLSRPDAKHVNATDNRKDR